MFELTHQAIAPPQLEFSSSGGFVVFEGRVRDHADGRPVTGLEYEAYEEMALAEGNKLLAEAVATFGLCGAHAIHRLGRLEIGEAAVWIATASAHRREAFAACEWIIDELKHRVPIWKRESFLEGDSSWVGTFDRKVPSFDAMWDRQTRMPEIGADGQAALAAAKVLLIGVGGLGCSAVPYLVGAGVGTIGLVDDDVLEETNLHRQVIYAHRDLGRKKVERAAAFAQKLNPGLQIHTLTEPLCADNAEQWVSSYDWVVDGTDSLETKFLLNAVCRKLGKPFVTASVHRFEGHLMTVLPDGPCLNCMFPEPPPNGCVGNCAQSGVLGVVPGVFGQLQALEVIKGIVGFAPTLDHELLLIDLRTYDTIRIERPHRVDCPGCLGVLAESDLVLSDLELCRTWEELRIIDIREIDEQPELALSHIRVPLSRWQEQRVEGPAVLVCATGVRSVQLAASMRAEGRTGFYSLKGGVRALFTNVERR